MAGAAYVLVSHPFETVAVRLQLDCLNNPKYNGMIDCFRKILRRHGVVHGVFKGMAPTLLRAFPSYAAAFFGYEYALKAYSKLALEYSVP